MIDLEKGEKHIFYVHSNTEDKNVIMGLNQEEYELISQVETEQTYHFHIFASIQEEKDKEILKSLILQENVRTSVYYQKEESYEHLCMDCMALLERDDFINLMKSKKVELCKLENLANIIGKEKTQEESDKCDYRLKRIYRFCWETGEKSGMIACGSYFLPVAIASGKIKDFHYMYLDYFISHIEFFNERGPYSGFVKIQSCFDDNINERFEVKVEYILPSQKERDIDQEELRSILNTELNGVPITITESIMDQ